jgi:uncharacterized SAM-binding protein YcdF (DUF218 family)
VAFIVGKLVWLVLMPGNFLLLLLLAGILLARRRKAWGRVLIGAAAVGFLACAVLPLGDFLVSPLENRFLPPHTMPERVDGIVVLGGAIDTVLSAARGQAVIDGGAARLTETITLARRYPDARIVISGGEGTLVLRGEPEAEAAKALMIDLGVAADRIEAENRSRTTAENARFAHEMVRPQPGTTWLLVTSAFHMPRSVGSFRQAGWQVVPYPVDYRTAPNMRIWPGFDLAGGLALLTTALKEWVGLAGYYATGQTDALLPGPARS